MNFHDRSDFEWRAKRSRLRLRVFLLLLFLLLHLLRVRGMVKRKARSAGRSVSRFSARQSVTFPRIKFESIFLSVILVTPAYNNVGGKRSRGWRKIVSPLVIHSLSFLLQRVSLSLHPRQDLSVSSFTIRDEEGRQGKLRENVAVIPGLLGAAHARQPFHVAREPFIFNGAREMAEMLSREVDGKERERGSRFNRGWGETGVRES